MQFIGDAAATSEVKFTRGGFVLRSVCVLYCATMKRVCIGLDSKQTLFIQFPD